MKQLLILSLITVIFFGGCKDQPTNIDVPLYNVIANGTEYLTAEQVQQYYQQPNSIGIIRLLRIEYNTCWWGVDGTYGPYDFYPSELTDAIFWDSGNPVNIGDHFEMNEMPIKQYADKTVYSNLGGDYTAPIYFDGGINRFEFFSNSLFPGFKDSLTFTSPIHITNIERLDTVYSNSDLTLNWSGGSSQGKIRVSITVSQLVDNYKCNGEITGIQYYITPNSNKSIIIPKQILKQLNTTYAIGNFYNISLTTAAPKTIITPNNKIISVLGVSRHEVTVVLKH